jgi:hypothetical protein
MPRKQIISIPASPDQCFVKELAGETPPSFEAMQRLYDLSSKLYGLRPWQILGEENLFVVRDSVGGELCFCSAIGGLGEVLAVQAYIGTEGLRQLRKIQAEELRDPGEFFAATHCVYVEFAPKADLLRQDKALLAALGHPQGRGLASPTFRTMRPGFLPWFVNAREAQMLTECLRAAILVCAAAAGPKGVNFWDQPERYPLVIPVEGTELGYRVEMLPVTLPPEPPLPPAQVPAEALRAIRSQDFTIHGIMELDLIHSPAAIGKKGQRCACAAVAIAVDAKSGMVLAPEVAESSVPVARVFLKAIHTGRSLPREVRVRNPRFKDAIAPLLESLGVTIRVAKRLPASEQAREHLLSFMG